MQNDLTDPAILAPLSIRDRGASGRDAADRSRRWARTPVSRLGRHLAHDPHLFLSLSIAVPVLLLPTLIGSPHAVLIGVASFVFLALQLVTSRLVGPTRAAPVDVARLLLALVYIGAVVAIAGDGSTRPLLVFCVPVVVVAAAMGTRHALAIGVGAVMVYMALVPLGAMPDGFVRERGIALVAVTLLLAISTRRTVSSLERATSQVRASLRSERIRNGRLAGLEEAGRILADDGPTDDALHQIAELVCDRFGYDRVEIHRGADGGMRVAAAAGAPGSIATGSSHLDTIDVPCVAEGAVRGRLLARLDAALSTDASAADNAELTLLADRVGSALALAEQHERLARRAARYEELTKFSQVLTTTLSPAGLFEVVAAAVGAVIPADSVTVTLRDGVTGEDRVVATSGGGEPATQAATDASVLSGPLMREGRTFGVLTVSRGVGSVPFDDLDRELFGLVVGQAALAITNAQLHARAVEASIRDSLTGVHNRRHLDAALERLSAARARVPRAERGPLAVILFDLDLFGQLNKRFGHGVGDEVLRQFGGLLRDAFRAGDLIARYGGEEFVIVLDGATRAEATVRAEQVRQRFRKLQMTGLAGESLSTTVSAGCAAVEDEASLDGLLATADAALAMAKAAGRDRVVAA